MQVQTSEVTASMIEESWVSEQSINPLSMYSDCKHSGSQTDSGTNCPSLNLCPYLQNGDDSGTHIIIIVPRYKSDNAWHIVSTGYLCDLIDPLVINVSS